MEINEENYSHIKGWGVDADPQNEPTYPMKNYTGEDHQRLNYERSEQQSTDLEILHSNERPSLTAVFGTSTPPSGISGAIRRFAFKYSENQYRHWLPLILADRVNMLEGIVDDIKHGHFPNVFAERGWQAEWKYNRKAMVTKIFVGALITSALAAILLNKNKIKRQLS